jgi:imidazolonepropionase-like amidohydrolase
MRMNKLVVFSGLVMLVFLGASVFGGDVEQNSTFLIKGAKIYTGGPRGVLTDACLLIEGGKIKKIIEGKDLPQVPVMDYSGKCIVPGLVDAHTYVSGYYRLLENSLPVTSDLAAFPAYEPSSPEVRAALAEGITTVNLSPRNENLVGGITSVFKLTTNVRELGFLKKEGFVKISFSKEMERDDRAPTSLMGAEEMLDEWMQKAAKPRVRDEFFPETGIAKLAQGELSPLIAASSYEEINTALNWLTRWKKKGIIVGGEEADQLADEIKTRDAAILLSPLRFSYPDKIFRNAASLLRKGVRMAFVSDMPEGEALGLRISAFLLTQEGISQEEALKTITLYPARILGVGDAVGSLEEGKDADFVVFSGEPLDLRSRISAVYSDGRAIDGKKE